MPIDFVEELKGHYIVERQCEFGETEEIKDRKIVIKKHTGGDILLNPSDPDATLDGHKGPGYQVQIVETCHPENEVELIAPAHPGSSESKSNKGRRRKNSKIVTASGVASKHQQCA